MITGLKLDKFQGFADEQNIEVKPLTLVYGPNASGKSSILRAIRLIAQSSQAESVAFRSGKFVFEGDLLSMASFENAVFRHDLDEEITIGVTLTGQSIGATRDRRRALSSLISSVEVKWTIGNHGHIQSYELLYHLAALRSNGRIEIPGDSSIWLKFQRNEPGSSGFKLVDLSGLNHLSAIATIGSPDSPEDTALESMRLDFGYLSSSKDTDWESVLEASEYHLWGLFVMSRGSGRGAPGPLGREAREDAGEGHQDLFLSDFLSIPRLWGLSQFRGVSFVGPLRNIEQRLTFEEGLSTLAGAEGANSADLEAIATVSRWLKELTNNRYSFEPIQFRAEQVGFLGQLRADILIDNLTGTQVSFQDVGVGLSQILPVLRSLQAILSGSPLRGGVLLIEQPELHLHPRMQAELVDLFAEVIQSRGNSQIVAETHSEALLLRVQKLLRSGRLSPNQVQILFVDGGLDGNCVEPIALQKELDFELDLPVSFAGLRLSEYL